MAIWQIELDNRDVVQYRRRLKSRGFISANYFSSNGFDLTKMRKLPGEGKLDAVRCIIGQSVRWYYAEEQAEFARLKGLVR
ncbi:hypothetical protein SPSIL_029260 [Sporomusa silvacetica DSM 10669]|uniref:Uncharacterized protein n=1 Tax=Sporomusa silvacetica DSM 10669 TaxID=1123289 RepID=A0ABZ3IME0_9FIRM|nr:hypothetical protein [Sporomusa silvacetica]OZC15724.1 hypothetical protein SPSIL_40540 [Sporomusa silvacetica DSM 10669]